MFRKKISWPSNFDGKLEPQISHFIQFFTMSKIYIFFFKFPIWCCSMFDEILKLYLHSNEEILSCKMQRLGKNICILLFK